MATRKASPTTKGQAALQKLAEAMGGTLDMTALMGLKTESDQKGSSNQEAQFVLQVLHKYHTSMMKRCKRTVCGAVFQTDYCHNNYCSDLCIAADMRDMGMKWDPFERKRWEHVVSPKDNLRYRYEPPQVISTEVLQELEKFATDFLADLSRLRDQAFQQSLETLAEQQDREQPEHDAPAELNSTPEGIDDPYTAEDSPAPTIPLEALPALEAVEDFFA